MNNLTIRLETEKDYRAVEELTREAFWNVYKPGADEHYYVHQIPLQIGITHSVSINTALHGEPSAPAKFSGAAFKK